MEKVLRNAKEKYIQVYTTIEDVITNATSDRHPEEETEKKSQRHQKEVCH